MTREEEAILRARSRWNPRRKPSGSYYWSIVEASDGILECVTTDWILPWTNNVDWAWARRKPAWERAQVKLIPVARRQ